MSSSYDPRELSDGQSSSSNYILSSSSDMSSSASVPSLSDGVHTDDTARSYKNPPEYYECLPDPNSSRTYGPVFPPLTYTYQLSFRAEAAYRSFLLPSAEIIDINATAVGDGGTSSYRENRLVVGEDNVSGILSTYVIPSLKDVVLDGLAGLHRLREYVSDESVRLCDSDGDSEKYILNRQRRRLRTGRRDEEEKRSLSSSFSDERHVVGIYPFVNEGDVESDIDHKHVTSNGGRIITGVKCESFGNEMEDRYPCIVIQESILLTVSSSSSINDIEFSSLQSIYHGLQDDNGWLASALESPSSYGLGVSRGVIRKVKFINGAGAAAVYPPPDQHTNISPVDKELNGPEIGLIILAALAILMLSLCCFTYRNARVKKIVGYRMEAATERIKRTKLAAAIQRQLDKKRIYNREMMQMPQANIDVIQWREALQDAKLESLSQRYMAESTEDDSTKDCTTKEGSSSRSDQLSSDSDRVSVEESIEICRTGTEEAGTSEDATEETESDEKELGEEESEKSNATDKKIPTLMALSMASRASKTLSIASRSSKSPKAFSMASRSSKLETESSSYTEGLTPSTPGGTKYDDPSDSLDVEDPPGSSMSVAASSLSNVSSTTDVTTFSKSAVTILGPYPDPALVDAVPVPVPAPPPADPLCFVRADPLNLSKTHSVLDVHKCSSATCKLCFQNSQIKFVSTDF